MYIRGYLIKSVSDHHMIKNSKCLSALLAASALVAACNSDYEPAIVTSENVEVTAFSLTADAKVLSNLDSVFFSIDLVNARIFNADSLPYGTKVNKLIPKITTQGVREAELIVPRPGKADTTYNYLTNATDSIDFSNGPVRLRLVSQSGAVERSYQIKVNVHQVKSDSLEWGGAAIDKLPGRVDNLKESRTVEFAGKFYTMLNDGTNYYMATQSHPATGYKLGSMTLPYNGMQGLDVNSFHATSNAAYVLGPDGALLTSSDADLYKWNATSVSGWHAIVATYADQVIGSRKKADGSWTLEYYPSGKSEALPAGFPVRGTSQTVSYRFEMSTNTNVLILGGRTAKETLTADCWSYDGNTWAKLTSKNVMLPIEGVTLIPYFTIRTGADWVSNRFSTLVAFGGRNGLGTISRDVYISYDFGIQWIKAGELMQLPAYVPATEYAQAFVVDEELTVDKAKSAPARIVRPITSWECPYIYVYGGYTADGKLSDNLWRAVINRFTFKPIE